MNSLDRLVAGSRYTCSLTNLQYSLLLKRITQSTILVIQKRTKAHPRRRNPTSPTPHARTQPLVNTLNFHGSCALFAADPKAHVLRALTVSLFAMACCPPFLSGVRQAVRRLDAIEELRRRARERKHDRNKRRLEFAAKLELCVLTLQRCALFLA